MVAKHCLFKCARHGSIFFCDKLFKRTATTRTKIMSFDDYTSILRGIPNIYVKIVSRHAVPGHNIDLSPLLCPPLAKHDQAKKSSYTICCQYQIYIFETIVFEIVARIASTDFAELLWRHRPSYVECLVETKTKRLGKSIAP